MPISEINLGFGLPFGVGTVSGTWKPDPAEREAAWEMYVELVTRVTIVELPAGQGLLREALSSYHSLFGTTREILRRHGSKVAKPKRGGTYSFGRLAVIVLNDVLRPLLAEWHPRLQAYEHQRPEGTSPAEHEAAWEYNGALREAIGLVRQTMLGYERALREAADVPSLIAPAQAE